MRTAETLIRLGGCPGWSESSLGAHATLLVLSCRGSLRRFYHRILCSKATDRMANSVDPDQTAPSGLLIWVYTVSPNLSARIVRIIQNNLSCRARPGFLWTLLGLGNISQGSARQLSCMTSGCDVRMSFWHFDVMSNVPTSMLLRGAKPVSSWLEIEIF